ncbi:ABC transporter substrate-binding protein [Leucobacter chromiiresistens]|uniref:Iron(III) transport system substrate-binding protein n=1 Tax=Leucobacter chromiiresistens TaxID=1079994 RepID=A0A1H0Z8C8_9MICO|nr:ABC transporter substrate-binding protein [Leucobacter chromiiresistens]SDQ23634.1 iron(III) transport system substrate-binding protein [Leucobacter chromiiresistens]
MSRNRSTGVIAAFALSALALTGCAASADAADTSATDAAEASTITLYTSEPQEKIDAIVAAFGEQHPEITVDVFRAGTGDLTARIAAEEKAGDIGADLLLAADAGTFEDYAERDLLLEYASPEAEAINQDLVDPEHFYVGTRLLPTVIAVNTNAIDEAPTSWQDLTDPEYAGKIAMPNPDVSGAAAYNAAVWLDEDALGLAWLEGLAANEPLIAESNGPVSQAVAEGSSPVGIVVDSLVRDLAAAGSPIEAVYPEEGVPFVSQPVGIFADTEEAEASQLFVDFLISREGQEIAASQSYLPIRDDVESPEGAPAIGDITLLNPDLETIRASQADAVETFNGLFQ